MGSFAKAGFSLSLFFFLLPGSHSWGVGSSHWLTSACSSLDCYILFMQQIILLYRMQGDRNLSWVVGLLRLLGEDLEEKLAKVYWLILLKSIAIKDTCNFHSFVHRYILFCKKKFY